MTFQLFLALILTLSVVYTYRVCYLTTSVHIVSVPAG